MKTSRQIITAAGVLLSLAFALSPRAGKSASLGGPEFGREAFVSAVDRTISAAVDASGNLVITDAADAANNITVKLVNGGSDLEITDATESLSGAPGGGPLSNSDRTLTIPISAVTGSLTINTGRGADTVTLDLSGGNFINDDGVFYNGGDPTTSPGDKLVIIGGPQGAVTYNYTNSHDGSIVMSNFGTVTYTGLEPIANSGTATDVVFNLPGTADAGIFLEDNGATPADGMLRLRSANATFEQTDFALPTGSLTINLGANAQTLTVSSTPQLTSSLTINGGTGDDTINLNSAITFAAGKNLNVDLQNDDPAPGIDTITFSAAANYILSGTGTVTLKASRNIQILGHIATQNGAINIEANQQAAPTAASFVGVNLSGASAIVECTGTGAITILGKGGNATSNHGVQVINSGSTVRGGSVPGGDSVTIVGQGVAGTSSIGSFIPNGDIFTLAGNIRITGSGFGSGAGCQIQNGSTIQPATNYSVIIDAKSQNPTGSVAAFNMLNIGTVATGIFTTGTGTVTIIADSFSLQTTGTLPPVIDAGTSTVFIRQKTNGQNIDIGSTAGTAQAGVIDIGDNELDKITAGTIQIGDANTGTISITNVISPATYKTLGLGKSAAFTSGATTGGFDMDIFSATDYEKITVEGTMTINPAATLNVTAQGGYVPASADSFTVIDNDSTDAIGGTFSGKPEGTQVAVGGVNKPLTYAGGTGNDVVLGVPPAPAQALNVSTRLRVQAGNNVLIGGFIITGNANKNIVLRGIGPSLSSFGITDALADPTLELRDGSSLIFGNDNWQDNSAQADQLSSVGLGLPDPKESGIFATLQPGAYTAIVAGKNQGSGIGVVEIYDTNKAADAQLANISTRGFVQAGNNVMIGGFILGGNANTRVAVRGIGPSLAQFGLSPLLADPTLELRDGNGMLLVANDDWMSDSASASQLAANGLALSDGKEAGIFTSLPAGQFTAILAGKNGGTGIGLVEIYNLK